MSLNTIWHAYQEGGLAAAEAATPEHNVEGRLYLAALAFAEENIAAAVEQAEHAAHVAGDRLLPQAAAAYLRHVAQAGSERVYDSGEAFGAFIRGGGNVPLYQALSNALCRIYDDYTRLDLLDVGVGDGLALLPAFAPCIARLDLVEPSAEMLRIASHTLDELEIPHNAHYETIQQFMQHGQGPWDLIQATFSLQALSPDERVDVLPWLYSRGARLLIAEFDLPELGEQLSPARSRYMQLRYERGLAEYSGNDLVTQGFLMPIFFSSFARRQRENYEQSIELWEFELRNAGFTNIERRHLYDYWWAPAYVIDAG